MPEQVDIAVQAASPIERAWGWVSRGLSARTDAELPQGGRGSGSAAARQCDAADGGGLVVGILFDITANYFQDVLVAHSS